MLIGAAAAARAPGTLATQDIDMPQPVSLTARAIRDLLDLELQVP